MVKRWSLAVLLIAVFMVFPLSAATVSFMVIESGLPEESGSSSWSNLWESGLLDVFFDAGHIVSNAPVKRLGIKPRQTFPDEAKAEFDEAAAGGVEYFILALLDYPPPAGNEIPRPRNIVLRVFRVSPYRFLHEEQYAGTGAANMGDEFTNIKRSVRGLIAHLADK
jgi:hypothetical protein